MSKQLQKIQQGSTMASNSIRTKQVFFIDSAVPGSDVIVANLATDAVYYLLDATQDGLQQVADILAEYSGLDSIHVISHGSPGSLQLGNGLVTQTSLGSHTAALSTIGSALTDTGDLLLYGCDVAQGEVGQAFIQQLASATGADVAASDDLTGSSALNADWNLESTVGQIETTGLNPEYSGTLSIDTSSIFNYVDALTAAEFSQAAYFDVNSLSSWESSLNWEPIKLGAAFDSAGGYEVSNAYAFAAKKTDSNGTVEFALSFEGSNPDQAADWTSTNFSEYGWSNYYVSLMPLMTQVIRDALIEKDAGHNVDILITGHSLGGAAASVAFADLFLNPGQNFWVEDQAPLKNGSRIYDQATLDAWTDEQIHSLVNDTSVYTFGAPSFLIDPIKPNGAEWAGLGLGSLLDIATGSWGKLITDWGDAVSTATTVIDSLLPNLTDYASHVFQFEHEDSSLDRLSDPVASIGTKDAGTVLDIDLTSVIHDRYNTLLSLPQEHSIDGYLESIARAITGAELVKPDTPLAASSLLLPSSSTGMSGNDSILAGSTGSGGAGNDILIAQTSTTSMNGGTGQDAYVIRDYGVNVTLSGPVNEKLDTLYFNILGQVSAYEQGENLVITISSPSGQSSVTVTGWYSASNNYQLSEITKIRPIDQGPWNLEHYNFKDIDISLFNIGTSQNDHIIGSFSADNMTGDLGDDTMDGRDGNDTIYGGDGVDELSGGSGDDSLHGDAGNDNLMGDDGTDTLFGGTGDDVLEGGSGSDILYGEADNDVLRAGQGDMLFGGTGNDQYVLNEAGNITVSEANGGGSDEVIVEHSSIQPISTRFTISGNDLLVSVFDAASASFSVVTIQAFLTNPVEYLTVSNGGQNLRYNLNTVWQLADIGDNVASSAIITSQSNWPWHFGTDGDDTINGFDSINDYLRGYGGNDTLNGLAGNDQLFGMDGNDTLDGGAGNDRMSGGASNDTINVSGNSGFDTVDGGTGSDTLNLDWSSNSTGSYLAFSVQKTDSSWIHFGKHW
ncbi:DUF4347 domain-containing protein, partial [Methylobacter sp.]